MLMKEPLSIVIQAGGESRRMGKDKGLLPFLGEPLITRVLRGVAMIADEVLVTTNQPEHYRFLSVPLFSDIVPGHGALGGLYTALKAASHPLVGVVACDMPFVSTALLTAERNLLTSSQADVAIPQTGEGQEPFHAVYRKSTCLPHVYQALLEGKWRVDSWFNQVCIQTLSPVEIQKYDPQGLCFYNINTPEELQEAIRIASAKNIE